MNMVNLSFVREPYSLEIYDASGIIPKDRYLISGNTVYVGCYYSFMFQLERELPKKNYPKLVDTLVGHARNKVHKHMETYVEQALSLMLSINQIRQFEESRK